MSRWLALAEEAARRGGDFLANRSSHDSHVITESRRDVKLEADRQSEQRILAVLLDGGDIDVLTEERGFVGRARRRSGWRWIVDPLDGTVNYFRGLPLCCVSVALWQDDDPVLGVIYDFNRRELFSGVAGEGAWLNGAPIRVSETPCKERAVLCTGFPVGMDFSPASLASFLGRVRAYRKVRMLGSAALSLAHVAVGRADAYYEHDIRLWDVAAGVAIVAAAGGRTVRTPSSAPYTITVYAGNSALDVESERDS